MGRTKTAKLRVMRIAAAIAALLTGAASAAVLPERRHAVNHRLALRIPPPHELKVTRRAVSVGAHPRKLKAFIQIADADGRLSAPVRSGTKFATRGKDGAIRLRISFTARYYANRHRLGYAVAIRNLRVPAKSARRARLRVVVTVQYRQSFRVSVVPNRLVTPS